MITIGPMLIQQMQAHATAWYPSECCGLLFAETASDAVVRVACMDNLADKLHARNPEDFPRSGHDYFSLNERQAHRLAEEASARGERWSGIFHSHIDCGAYFSDEDQAMAAPDGHPVDPAMWHVVMECRQRVVVMARAFIWRGGAYVGFELPGFAGKQQ
jgi:proteasome lid subunit RPN8/RPN11